MNANESPHRAGFCPRCGVAIAVPDLAVGLWDGETEDGRPAGGGVWETECHGCGAKLVAYDDVYDDAGQIAFPEVGTDPELLWAEDDD